MQIFSLIDPYAVRVDGTKELIADWDAGDHKITAEQLAADIADGTAPLIIASATLVSNLNADLWDGYEFADYINQAVKTTSSPTFDSLTINGINDNIFNGNVRIGSLNDPTCALDVVGSVQATGNYTSTSTAGGNIFYHAQTHQASVYGVNVLPTLDASVNSAQSVVGASFSCSINGASGDLDQALLCGVYSLLSLGSNYTGTLTDAIGFDCDFSMIGAGPITNLYGVRIDAAPVSKSTNSITNGYGIYIGDFSSVDITNRYAIYTNAGPIHFGDDVDLADGKNLVFDTTTGTKIGTATGQKIGFYGVTPVDQPLTVSDPAGGGTVDTEARTAVNTIIDRLQELGLVEDWLKIGKAAYDS